MNEDEVKFCSNWLFIHPWSDLSDIHESCLNEGTNKRDIPLGNFVMHNMHCLRNLALCTKCDEPVPRLELTSHNASFHATVECPACGHKLEKMNLDEHQRSSCKRRPICCNYCHIETEANELPEHENYCGSRTERCEECGEFVMMKYQQLHEDSNHGFLKLEDEPGPTPSWSRPPPTVLNDLGRQRKVPNSAPDARPTAETNRLSPSKRTNDMPQVNSAAAASQPKALHKPVLQQGIPRLTEYPNKHTNMSRVNSTAAVAAPKVLHKPVLQNDDCGLDLNHLLALRLSQQAYLPDNVDVGDLVALPCEFCEAMVPANQLVMHETGCRPDLACFTASVPEGEGRRSQDGGLPCEFCEGLFPPEDLWQHQALCDSSGPDRRVVNQLGFTMQDPSKAVKKQLNLPGEPRLFPHSRRPSDLPSTYLDEMRAALNKPPGGLQQPAMSPSNNTGGADRPTEVSTGAVPKQKARRRVTLREVNQEASRTPSSSVVPTTRPSNTNNLQR